MQRKLRITKHFSMLYPIHGTRWAVIVYVYSGTTTAVSVVSVLVSRYSGDYSGLYSRSANIVTASVVPLLQLSTIVAPRYAVDCYTDAPGRLRVNKVVVAFSYLLIIASLDWISLFRINPLEQKNL